MQTIDGHLVVPTCDDGRAQSVHDQPKQNWRVNHHLVSESERVYRVVLAAYSMMSRLKAFEVEYTYI